MLPLAGVLIAAGLVITRRPDAVTHAQFWAEDGPYYFANVYNHGLLTTLATPQAGYFQTFPVLAARVAEFVSLAHAPLVMNVLALAAQVLPVGLLLSRRAVTISPNVWVRALLAFVYLALPVGEINVTAVNAQWHLAVAALIVLLLAPPQHPLGRWFDGAILLACGLTGPFCLILAPLAWVRRHRAGPASVTTWEAALLTACAVLQSAALLIVSHHPPAGVAVEPRPSPGLGATPTLIVKLVGGRLLLGAVVGQANGLRAPLALQLIAMVAAGVVLVLIARAGRDELRLAVAFGVVLFAASLLAPSAPTPAWRILASTSAATPRYYFIPQLVVLAVLVWGVAACRLPVLRLVAAGLLTVSIGLIVAGHWTYRPFASIGFPQKAAAFERAPRGTVAVFALNPLGFFTMTLTKR